MSPAPEYEPLTTLKDLIAPGRPLPFRVMDAQGRLLLAQGQRVMDVRQLAGLLERGACVLREEAEAERRLRQGVIPSPVASARVLTWFDRWERHVWDIDEALRQIARGVPGVAALDELVSRQMALVTAQPDAALFTMVRQDDRRFALYALTHARHTATVVQLTAGVLGWPPERQRCAVAVALTMNAAIVELQARMAEQAEPPTLRQKEQIGAHPAASAALLRAVGVVDEDWLAGVEQHHEHAGGGGYPAALQAPGDIARVVRAADVFAAKISPRAIRAALPPQTAARQLFQEEKGSAVAGGLIKAVGLYPPGDLVRLHSGEAAVVLRRQAAGPEVSVLVSATGKLLGGGPHRDTAQPGQGIAGPLQERAGLPRLLPEQVYGLLYL